MSGRRGRLINVGLALGVVLGAGAFFLPNGSKHPERDACRAVAEMVSRAFPVDHLSQHELALRAKPIFDAGHTAHDPKIAGDVRRLWGSAVAKDHASAIAALLDLNVDCGPYARDVLSHSYTTDSAGF